MAQFLNTWDQGTVKTVDWKGRVGSKEGFIVMASGEAGGITFIYYLQKGENDQRRVLWTLIADFER